MDEAAELAWNELTTEEQESFNAEFRKEMDAWLLRNPEEPPPGKATAKKEKAAGKKRDTRTISEKCVAMPARKEKARKAEVEKPVFTGQKLLPDFPAEDLSGACVVWRLGREHMLREQISVCAVFYWTAVVSISVFG